MCIIHYLRRVVEPTQHPGPLGSSWVLQSKKITTCSAVLAKTRIMKSFAFLSLLLFPICLYHTAWARDTGDTGKLKSSPIFFIQTRQGQQQDILPVRRLTHNYGELRRSSRGRHFKSYKLSELDENKESKDAQEIFRPPVKFLLNGKPLNTEREKKILKNRQNSIRSHLKISKKHIHSELHVKSFQYPRQVYNFPYAKINGNPAYLYHLDYRKPSQQYKKFKILKF